MVLNPHGKNPLSYSYYNLQCIKLDKETKNIRKRKSVL